MKSKILTLSLLVAAAFSARATAFDLTVLGATYSQTFTSLANSGTSSTLPEGWAISESGTSANVDGSYTAGTGSGTAGDTYSFGSTASTDRALGTLLSGTFSSIIGVQFQNLTGGIITSLTIGYTGEQWRLGTAGRADQLNFQYSLNATSLDTGTWIDVIALNFTSPYTGTAGARDGNAAANRTALSTTISALNIASGTTLWLRWTDFDATGADDGLAVDDFRLTANGYTPQTSVPDSLPAGFAAMILFIVLALGHRFGHQALNV